MSISLVPFPRVAPGINHFINFDFILIAVVKLMKAPFYVLQLVISLKSLLGGSGDSVLKKILENTLKRVLVPQRIAHLVRLLQGQF